MAFEVLAGCGGAIGYSDMKAVLDDLVANYRDEVVADIENLESFGDRREVLIDLVSRVELLCERSTGTDELLGAWRMVGYAMAALVAVLSRRGYDFPRAAGGDDASLRKVLAPLRQANSRLPTAEAASLNSMLPKLLPGEPRWLASELVTTFRSAIEFLNQKSRTSASLGAGLAPSYIGSSQQSGASGEVVDRAERLPRSAKLAWSQFTQAELELGDGVEDKKAYAWLVEEREMSLPEKPT